MAYLVKITAPAEKDLSIAYERIKDVAPYIAERWLREIFATIFSLNEMPERCPLAPESEAVGFEIRHILHGKRSSAYRIIFDIQNDSVVRILRVWHGYRDRIEEQDL